VRIFSTDTGNALQELRRGREKAEIHSICFDLKGGWLACSSDRSTIHIFTVNIKADSAKIKLSDEEAKAEEERPENKKSGLKFLKGISTYFDSEWSFARFKIPNDDNSDNHTCAFSQDGSHMVVVSKMGTYYLAQVPKNGGNCKIIHSKKFVE
jgi:WD repeat-containing protein 45